MLCSSEPTKLALSSSPWTRMYIFSLSLDGCLRTLRDDALCFSIL